MFPTRDAKLTDGAFQQFFDVQGQLPGAPYFLEKILWNKSCSSGSNLRHIKLLAQYNGPFTNYRFLSPIFDVSRGDAASV